MNEKVKKILENRIIQYGYKAQLGVVQEECAELIVAVSHYLRGRYDAVDKDLEEVVKPLYKEVMDVQVMLWQLQLIFGFEELDRDAARMVEEGGVFLQRRS